jgi:hypothetical protein
VPYIHSVFVLRENVTLRCDVLCTTYRIRAKHFVSTNCVKYTTAHRPQTTNHSSTFNSQIRLTRTDHTLTIKTQINTTSKILVKPSWSLIKKKIIIGHMQYVALLSIFYVRFTRLPYVALLSFASCNAALPIGALLFFSLPPHELNNLILLSNPTTRLNTRDEI